MGKIIEACLNLISFSQFFTKFGLNEDTCKVLSAIILAILLLLFTNLCKYFVNRYKYTVTARDLSPHFDFQKVKSAREYFIQSQFQNNSPAREEEPKFTHKYISRSLLIPFFIKTAFNEKKESDKFYLILADSGMGKTTFMINLYVSYTSFFNIYRKHKIKLLPFGDPKILDRIKDVKKEDVTNTILLLDAFDIEKWIEREANKRKHRKKDREIFMQNLLNYSQLVAVEIYKQRQESSMLCLSKNDAGTGVYCRWKFCNGKPEKRSWS